MDNDNVSSDTQALLQTEKSIPEEKVFTQSEVNKIVGARAHDAAEKARRETARQFEERMKDINHSSPSSVDNEDIERRIESKVQANLQKRLQEEEARRAEAMVRGVADKYTSSIMDKDLKSRYQDVDEVMGDFNARAYPNLIYLATMEENTGELMYHLAQDLVKASQFDELARRDPNGAAKALKKFSKSILQNIDAKQSAKKAQEPLSRMRPTTVGADNGPMTVNDWKKDPICRG